MTREFFNQQFAALASAYTMANKLSDEAQDIYWEMLKDIPEKAFSYGVRECLASCKFFPTIAELGEASLPTKKQLGPYNPYGESIIVLDWRAQVEKIKQERELIDGRKENERYLPRR